MKIFNRGVSVNVKNEDALIVNGVVIIDKYGKIYGDIHAAAGSIGTTELADSGVTAVKLATDAVETAKIKNANVTLAKLAASISPVYVIKFFVLGSSITGSTLEGLLVNDLVLTVLADGTSVVAPVTVADTLPADPADTTYIIVFRATA